VMQSVSFFYGVIDAAAIRRSSMIILLSLLISSCSWLGIKNNSDDYLTSDSIPRVTIPEGLDTPVFTDALIVPAVDDARGLTGVKVTVGLPDPLSTATGVEQIVIRKLGEDRWVFIDTPPAAVWPKIRLFWEVNNMELQSADARRGVLESVWLASVAGEPDKVFESLKSGVAWADSNATVQNKFRLSIEAGIRSGSSEVHLEHKQVPRGAPVRQDTANWNGTSDDGEIEAKVLSELAYFLGETIPQGFSISQGAMNISSSRIELLPDRIKPVLRLQLDFDRAWATVGKALGDASINIDDRDRTSANYYILYDATANQKAGFFSRLFTDEATLGEENKYQVHLESHEDGVHVIINKDQTNLADPLVAERLLKIIKEHSS
jgi:outer membrane protein assembly factor BamC